MDGPSRIVCKCLYFEVETYQAAISLFEIADILGWI